MPARLWFQLWIIAACCLIPAAPSPGSERDSIERLRTLLREHERAERDRDVLSVIEQLAASNGLHAADAMTAGAALARLGELEAATEALRGAIERDFIDRTRLQRDPAFAPLRRSGAMRALKDEADRRRRAQAAQSKEALRDMLGSDARFAFDEQRGILFAAKTSQEAFDEMQEEIARLHDSLARHLTDGGPPSLIRIVIPAPEDAPRWIGQGDPPPTGRYDHATRTVLARHSGASLRHEYVHAMHYGHMERLGLRTPHPLWIQEGLATLFEHIDPFESGDLPRARPNARTRITSNLARGGRLTQWSRLMSMPASRFMTQPTRHYPEVRSIFEFLAEKNRLTEWYAALIETFDEDRTGARAFERAFDRPIEETERAYRRWARDRAIAAEARPPQRVSLGAEWNEAGANDGLLIARVTINGPLADARLRREDVLWSVESLRIHDEEDLELALLAHAPGDTLRIRYRRGTNLLEAEVLLAPPPRGLGPR